jgi:hypothetical protein
MKYLLVNHKAWAEQRSNWQAVPCHYSATLAWMTMCAKKACRSFQAYPGKLHGSA